MESDDKPQSDPLKKSADDSLRDVFIYWKYTDTVATHTERFAITFWKGKTHQKV